MFNPSNTKTCFKQLEKFDYIARNPTTNTYINIFTQSHRSVHISRPLYFLSLSLLLCNSQRALGCGVAMHDAACCSVVIRLHVTLNGVYFQDVMVAVILLLLSRVCAPALFWPIVIVVKCPQDQRDAPKNRSPKLCQSGESVSWRQCHWWSRS